MKRSFLNVLRTILLITVPTFVSAEDLLEVDKLLVNDAFASAALGKVVAVFGETVVIGDPYDSEQSTSSGAVHVFERDGTSWVLQDKLMAADGQEDDLRVFGTSVAISNDTIVIGDIGNDELAENAGAVYVYVRTGSTWTQQDKLMASDGASSDQFGFSVTIDGDTIVVGARYHFDREFRAGAAYVFVRNGSTWSEQDKLIVDTTREYNWLGTAVAISGDTALVTAKGCCLVGVFEDTGAVYVFVRDGVDWTQEEQLLADDGAGQDLFGYSVAVVGDTAFIGAPQDRINGSFSGSAYIFDRAGTTWTQQDKLLPGSDGGIFGLSLSMSGDTALIGDRTTIDGHPGGSAYLYERVANNWVQQQKFSPGDAETGDAFGWSVSISSGTAVVGASGDDDLGDGAGAAYVYRYKRFNDVAVDHWAFPFIEKLFDSGITAGCGGGNYCPLDPVTRAQMAVFLERGMNGSAFSPPAAIGNVFLDVGAQDFAASFIEQLASDGITAGCGNNNYCPIAEVTRDQMAVFLLRAKYGSSYSPPTATGVFGDVDLGHWAVAWIEALAAEGITSGCGNGNYCPDAQVTRDQMAVFLVRTFGL